MKIRDGAIDPDGYLISITRESSRSEEMVPLRSIMSRGLAQSPEPSTPVDLSHVFARIDALERARPEPVVRDDGIADRIAALERGIIEIATEPMRDGDDGENLDLPAFMRQPGERRPAGDSHAARDTAERMAAIEQRLAELSKPLPPEPPSPVQQLAANAVLDRMTALERRLVAQRSAPTITPAAELNVLTPIERIQAASRQAICRVAPPLQVVEAAHLARSQQEFPLALMERVGRAMGVGWEDAATTIIRRHDKAAHIASEAYAIEIEANVRLVAGEPVDDIVAGAITAIEAIGGE
jgi:hypothetical protein